MLSFKTGVDLFVGAGLIAALGPERFYRIAQERGRIGRLARRYLEHQLVMFQNFDIMRASLGRDSITEIVKERYGDDSLAGYGSAEYARADNKPLEEQQRGLILPVLTKAIQRVGGPVMEIGSGNGDILALLAARYPEVQFKGVDLSVVTARAKHENSRATFIKGYALEMLEGGQLKGRVAFWSSTATLFAPRELARYLAALKASGFTDIVLSEPVALYVPTNDSKAYSRHIYREMWFHNYAGYLRRAGFKKIRHFERTTFSYSDNPNVPVVLVHGIVKP